MGNYFLVRKKASYQKYVFEYYFGGIELLYATRSRMRENTKYSFVIVIINFLEFLYMLASGKNKQILRMPHFDFLYII